MIVGDGRREGRLLGTLTDRTSHLAVLLAGDKAGAKWRLARSGISVPFGKLVDDEDGAVAAWRAIDGAVAVKPNLGAQGGGARADINDEGRVRAAWRAASRHPGRVLIEQHVTGRNLRVLVVAGRVVAVAERCAPAVTGDGCSTVAQLVSAHNAALTREGAARPIVLDEECDDHLAAAGCGRDTVPDRGEEVTVSGIASASRGATARPVAAPQAVTKIAVAAAAAIGLDIAGVDFICPRDAAPLVIEVNASPGIGLHAGGAEAAVSILDYLMGDMVA